MCAMARKHQCDYKDIESFFIYTTILTPQFHKKLLFGVIKLLVTELSKNPFFFILFSVAKFEL